MLLLMTTAADATFPASWNFCKHSCKSHVSIRGTAAN
jgi:hypothetical protein